MDSIRKGLFLFIAAVGMFSCKKNQNDLLAGAPTSSVPTVPAPPVSSDVLKDSALLIANDIYLWNKQIPSDFNVRSFADLNKAMEGIRPYSIEAGFPKAVDRWSFAMKKTEWDEISGGVGVTFSGTNGEAGDFGMTVFFRAEGDLRVRLVEPNSPSGKSGIRRGWRIMEINGNNNINTTNADFIINNIYSSNNASILFKKPDGSLTTISLAVAKYDDKQVYLDTVYNINNQKIGYLVFNSFLGNTAEIQSEFTRVFNKFSSQGITELIVDLRYNGGGYVDLQSRLANYLVKPSASGQLMMKQVYNDQNTRNNKVTNFQKLGNINLADIYFIVGRSTASASELLINNLKPYMDVKLVGSTTHGKPVGYSPIPVGDWYIFPVSFRTTNKNNEGNYFNGLSVNAQVADGLDKDWGDITETSLSSAIRNITTGSYSKEAPYIEPTQIAEGNRKLDESMLKITVDRKDGF